MNPSPSFQRVVRPIPRQVLRGLSDHRPRQRAERPQRAARVLALPGRRPHRGGGSQREPRPGGGDEQHRPQRQRRVGGRVGGRKHGGWGGRLATDRRAPVPAIAAKRAGRCLCPGVGWRGRVASGAGHSPWLDAGSRVGRWRGCGRAAKRSRPRWIDWKLASRAADGKAWSTQRVAGAAGVVGDGGNRHGPTATATSDADRDTQG